MQTLRDYQQAGLTDALEFVRENLGLPNRHRVYVAPTGTGKGTLQVRLLQDLNAAGIETWMVTPSVEIIRGTLPRLGVSVPDVCSNAKLARIAREHRIATPIALLNRINKGEIECPDVLLVDEVHEWVGSNSVPDTFFAVTSCVPKIGFTATPYRGTPKGTEEFRKTWGKPVTLLDIPTGIERGWLSFPEFIVTPLVDDDEIKVVNGEFSPKSTTAAYLSRCEALACLVGDFYSDGRFDVPTMVSVPGVEVASELEEWCKRLDIPARAVTQKTPGNERQAIYDDAQDGKIALIQVSVLTRGADLPKMKRLIDAQPTQSPVRWVQTIGRVMRPGSPSQVILTNRNLERHCLMLQGCVPPEIVRKSQDEFGSPSFRGAARVLGLENLSKHRAAQAPLLGGGFLTVYSLYEADESGYVTDFCCLLIPGVAEPLWATRERTVGEYNPRLGRHTASYGRWEVAQPDSIPEEFVGFSSVSTAPITPKQARAWERGAAKFGLDPARVENLTRKEIQVFFVLRDLRKKVA